MADGRKSALSDESLEGMWRAFVGNAVGFQVSTPVHTQEAAELARQDLAKYGVWSYVEQYHEGQWRRVGEEHVTKGP